MEVLLCAIPCSRPFLTAQNLLLENHQAVVLGILSMLALFMVLIIITARISSTDRVQTIKLRFGRMKLVIRDR